MDRRSEKEDWPLKVAGKETERRGNENACGTPDTNGKLE